MDDSMPEVPHYDFGEGSDGEDDSTEEKSDDTFQEEYPPANCEFRHVDPQPSGVKDVVLTMSDAAKRTPLARSTEMASKTNDGARKILNRIHNPKVVAMLSLQEEAPSNAPLRLLRRTDANVDETNEDLQRPLASFIVLSYCWHNSDWAVKAAHVLCSTERPCKCPITSTMFEALMAEREEHEAVWIDQLCINQSDEAEKAAAVGSMNQIYRSARHVVAVLEDVIFDAQDEQVLRNWIAIERTGHGATASGEDEALHDHDYEVMRKVFSAWWFSRAWCAHEFLMGRSTIFLAQLEIQPPDARERRVARVSAEFLRRRINVLLGKAQLRIHYECDRERSKKIVDLCNTKGPRVLLVYRQKDLLTTARPPHYMRLFTEIFEYQASIFADKLSITLNILDTGIYIRGAETEIDEEVCLYILYHIALGARDAAILTITGRSLSTVKWMRYAVKGDPREGLGPASFPPLEYAPVFDDDKLILNMIMVGNSASICRPNAFYMDVARKIMDDCTGPLGPSGHQVLKEVGFEPLPPGRLDIVSFWDAF